MDNNKLYTVISNNLQKNSNTYTNNEIFGLLGILVLLEITDIFHSEVKSLPESNPKQNNPLSSLGSIGNLGSLTGLLSQLQGNGGSSDGANIQQMLPLLMGALGGNNGAGNLDINKISSLVNSIKNNNTGDNHQEEHITVDSDEINNEQENNETDKKKVSGK